jgi:hypothetical protein
MVPIITTSLRLQQVLLDRADALIPAVAALPSSQAQGSIVRSDVLRLALSRGLDELEREYGAASLKSPSKPTKKR